MRRFFFEIFVDAAKLKVKVSIEIKNTLMNPHLLVSHAGAFTKFDLERELAANPSAKSAVEIAYVLGAEYANENYDVTENEDYKEVEKDRDEFEEVARKERKRANDAEDKVNDLKDEIENLNKKIDELTPEEFKQKIAAQEVYIKQLEAALQKSCDDTKFRNRLKKGNFAKYLIIAA